MAVAFFQRGIAFYKKNKWVNEVNVQTHVIVQMEVTVFFSFLFFSRYEESLGDFQRAFKALRGNQLIDYKALGLRYKLYACDVSLLDPRYVLLFNSVS